MVTAYRRLKPPLYFQPTGEPEERIYATPNNTVFAYSIDDWVQIVPHTGPFNLAVKYEGVT